MGETGLKQLMLAAGREKYIFSDSEI